MLESYILRPHLVQLRKMQILDHHLHYFHRVGRGFESYAKAQELYFSILVSVES